MPRRPLGFSRFYSHLVENCVADCGSDIASALSAAVADVRHTGRHDPLFGGHNIDETHRDRNNKFRLIALMDLFLQGNKCCRRISHSENQGITRLFCLADCLIDGSGGAGRPRLLCLLRDIGIR